MGQPINGDPLSWKEIQASKDATRKLATMQLLKLWHYGRSQDDYPPLWGDEIEYMLVQHCRISSRSRLLLEQSRVLEEWVQHMSRTNPNAIPCLQPEWARYMVESIPENPYTGNMEALLSVEGNMRERRSSIQRLLLDGQHAITLSAFPSLGIKEPFTAPYSAAPADCTQSYMLPQEIQSLSTRSKMLQENIIKSRTSRVETFIPVFRDSRTPRPFHDCPAGAPTETTTPKSPLLPEDVVHLDGFGFGAGVCSLQITLQAKNESDARWLHDQLIPLSPIMLALTASSPIYKGMLVDSDVRLGPLNSALNDGKPQHLTELLRSSQNPTYISEDPRCKDEWSRVEAPIDRGIERDLRNGGMDERLAAHFSYILSQEPLLLTREDIAKAGSPDDCSIFNAYQSCVWQHVRLKLPSPGGDLGWRIEFRPMEVQPRDSENAAFAIFMYLLSQVIITFGLDLYIPIEKAAESMTTAERRGAVRSELFWFRSDLSLAQAGCSAVCHDRGTYMPMSVGTIINGRKREDGKETSFPGLIAMVRAYLRHIRVSPSQEGQISRYLDIVSKRASGELATPAHWMREFVQQHPNYNMDSQVGQEVCFDLLDEIIDMGSE